MKTQGQGPILHPCSIEEQEEEKEEEEEDDEEEEETRTRRRKEEEDEKKKLLVSEKTINKYLLGRDILFYIKCSNK
jgi:hypothetical protein